MYEEMSNLKINGSHMPQDIIRRKTELSIDTFTVVWDNKGYIQELPEDGIFHTIKGKMNKPMTDMTYATLLNEDVVQTICHHFSTSHTPLCLRNVSLNQQLNHPALFDLEVTRTILGHHTYYIAYFIQMEKFYDWLAENEKRISVSQIAAGLVHEIRNPLTSLKGFLQLLQAGVSQKEEYYNVMIHETEKLEQLTNELLLMAKPKKQVKQKETVNQLIEDVLFLMNTQVNLRKINFHLNLQDGLHIYCNAVQIKQVFINLIKNSAEAMKFEGEVRINAYKEKDSIYISVSDDGEGMQDFQLKEAHMPFYTTKENGTGLGLVISKHIIKEHGGRCVFQLNENRGLTVIIELPSLMG